jgi:creatinine amidohydrolase/Fe(II)-dependent formamide hydrolase-like protein
LEICLILWYNKKHKQISKKNFERKNEMYTSQPATTLHKKDRTLVLLPIGSYEQHGPHLPIDTDLRIAQLIAEKLIETFPKNSTILLPAIPFSCSWEHKGLGTISLNTNTISSAIYDIALSLKSWKMPILFTLINWHGGNSALASIATEITAREEITTTAIQTIGLANQIWNEENEPLFNDAHAGTIETSIIQAYWPELIRNEPNREIDFIPNIEPATIQSIFQALGINAVSKTGVWGKPQQADAKKGKETIERTVSTLYKEITKLLEIINEVKSHQEV